MPRPERGDLDTSLDGHHDACMRTTLTLDEDVAKELKERARHSGESFKEVVNTTLRKGLIQGAKPVSRLPAFKVIAKTRGFRTGVDLLRLNQLYDELEIEDSQRTMEAGKNRQ